MLAMAIDKRWDRLTAHHVEPCANEREIILGEVDNARRLGDAAIEPGFDRVLVLRGDINRLWCHECTDMIGDDYIA